MMHLRIFFVAALCSVAVSVFAQSKPPAPATFASAIDAEITNLEKQFVDAAEAMPADKFDSSPENFNLPGSEFQGVRTFGQQVKHVAADNFAIWAPLTGKPEPAGLNAPKGPVAMKSRDEVLKFLKDSLAYSHQAVRGLTAENALGLVEFRGSKVTRISLVVLALTHISDHYGQMAEYLRMNGIVPPASNMKGMQMQMTKPSGK
ncbi:MAG: DinB family protein [Acidobacteriia bacterium]|nr:DinB family protein [Terriglobia bacterium]